MYLFKNRGLKGGKGSPPAYILIAYYLFLLMYKLPHLFICPIPLRTHIANGITFICKGLCNKTQSRMVCTEQHIRTDGIIWRSCLTYIYNIINCLYDIG